MSPELYEVKYCVPGTVEIKSRLGMLEQQYASISNRVDRIEMRLERIEKRLDLIEA